MSSPLPFSFQPSVVTLGNFDGVHLGHQALLHRVVALSHENKLQSLALFFYPHPLTVISNQLVPELTSKEYRQDLIEALGIERCHVVEFTPDLSLKTALEFLRHLKEYFNARMLVIGPTTHLGYQREGTPKKLQALGKLIDLEVIIVPETYLEGKSVSSSRIRTLLEQGDVGGVERLLGRSYVTFGKIISSRGLGTELGFPTLNLDAVATLLPKVGVYLSRSIFSGTTYWGLTNVGYRPTLPSADPLKVHVETHLLNYGGQVLAHDTSIAWVRRIRDEQKFSSRDELVSQIKQDITLAQQLILK